jgi:hypothetical protein
MANDIRSGGWIELISNGPQFKRWNHIGFGDFNLPVSAKTHPEGGA